jgi:transitional endoplasmic reticulum ATPase
VDVRKDRERKEKAEAAGETEDVNIMDEENEEDEVPAITV